MKSQILPGHKNHIILSGEIDPRYTVPPGTYVTFAKGSSFQEKDVSEEIFHNDEYIVRSFKQNLLGKIELTPLVIDSPSSSPLCELPLHLIFWSHQTYQQHQPVKKNVGLHRPLALLLL